MERFLDNFRAIKQSSSQQTNNYFVLVRSTKTRKSNIAVVGAKVEDRHELFRVKGLKYGKKSPYGFKIFNFRFWPFIVRGY